MDLTLTLASLASFAVLVATWVVLPHSAEPAVREVAGHAATAPAAVG